MVNSRYSWNQKFHHRTHPKSTMTFASGNLVSFNRNSWTELLCGEFFRLNRRKTSFLEFTLGIELHSMDTLYKETTLFSVSVTSLFQSSRSTAMNQVKSFRLILQVYVHYFYNNSRIESRPCRISDHICLTYILLFHTFWFYILHRSLNTNRC